MRFILTIVLIWGFTIQSQDWPNWLGPDKNSHLKIKLNTKIKTAVLWKKKIGGGYSGISTKSHRVYTMDSKKNAKGKIVKERILCLHAKDGKLLWSYDYEADYKDMAYNNGPRCTPTIYQGKVYTLGAVGHIHCLDAKTGKIIWQKDTAADYKVIIPTWGFSASAFLYKKLAIFHIAAQPNGSIIAFDHLTGTEIWRNLPDKAGYATPIVIQSNGKKQLIAWTPENIRALNIDNGKLLWSIPYKVTNGVSISTPIFYENIVFVSGYWEGSKAIKLNKQGQGVLLWQEKRYLRALMAPPLYKDGYVYLLDKRHGLTCFELKTGKKLWDDDNKMTPRGRNPHSFLVWVENSNYVFILNANGELIFAKLTPKKYQEISRTKIIGPTWAAPAFANECVYARSDTEIVAISLFKKIEK